MTGLEIALLCVVSVAVVILIIYTVIFLVLLIKTTKQVKIAAEKVQEGADNAVDLVDEVRRTVVNPGIISMMVEKYFSKARKSARSRRKDNE